MKTNHEPKSAKIVNTRFADESHVVHTVEGGRAGYRRQPCGGCPFRVDQTGSFPSEAFLLSAETAHDGSFRQFACHESGSSRPQTCAGFLLTCHHNIATRLQQIEGRLDLSEVTDGGHQLHSSYKAMAVANGVDPEDPTIQRCR